MNNSMRTRALVGCVALIFIAGCRSREAPAPTERAAATAEPYPDRAFWDWFVDHAPALAKEPSLIEVMRQVQRELDKHHRGVVAEIGPAGHDRLLVLSAGGDRSQFALVQQLFAAHPSVKGWSIVAFRPRDATRPMPKIAMNDHELDPATLRYVAERNEDKLDLQLYIPGYVDGDTAIGQLAFLALDHTVGEYDVEMKLGAIELVPMERAPTNAHVLDDLPREVDTLQGVLEQRP